MAKAPQENVRVPQDFKDVVNDLIPLVGVKRRWMVYAAGLLSLMELSEEDRLRIFRTLRADSFPGAAYREMIERAKARGRGEPRVAHEGDITQPAPSGREGSESDGSPKLKPAAGGPRGRRR